MKTIVGLTALSLLAAPAAAHAASSDWYKTEGARIRLLTTGQPDPQGRLAGALQIELEPGWKTYWRDPGSSGVAPSIDVSSTPTVANATISFPTPEWHNDSSGIWAGYDEPVVLPVEFGLRASGSISKLEAVVFLGVCQAICVPVQTKLTVDPQSGADDPTDAALVQAARSALPRPATDQLKTTVDSIGDKHVTLRIVGADEADVSVFLAGENGYMFGPPKRVPGGAANLFAADIITRPKARPQGAGIAYTLSTPGGAVNGFLPFF